MIYFAGSSYFLYISRSFARTQVKTLTVKFQITTKKTSILCISLIFFRELTTFQYRSPNIVVTLAKLLGCTLPNRDYQILWLLKHSCWTTLPIPSFPIPFLKGVHSYFWLLHFSNNIEDILIKAISCITYFAFFHAIFRTSEILLTFRRHQLMYSVSCVVPCAEVTCKGHFVIQYKSKEKRSSVRRLTTSSNLDLWSFAEFATIIFILFSRICLRCCRYGR